MEKRPIDPDTILYIFKDEATTNTTYTAHMRNGDMCVATYSFISPTGMNITCKRMVSINERTVEIIIPHRCYLQLRTLFEEQTRRASEFLHRKES